MVRTSSLLVLGLWFLGLAPACSTGRSGDDDDDDLIVDTGDGDADTDADTDGDGDGDGGGSCEDACGNIAEICPDVTQQNCMTSCSLIEDNLSGTECLDAFGDYNACAAATSECTDQGVQGCSAQSTALNTACENGCGAILDCSAACGDDQACGEACYNDATVEAQQALEGIFQCLVRECGAIPAEGTPEADTWSQCADAAVADPAKCADENLRCR